IVLAALAWQFEWRNLAAPQRTSVAILPFSNLSGDPKEDYVSDGITEDLITDLSKLSGVDVHTDAETDLLRVRHIGVVP
ncbi:hypothetical protein ACC687_42070, partial [Rhizobium ruizarguesonis]